LELTGEISLLADEETRKAGAELGDYLYSLQEQTLEKGESIKSGEGQTYLLHRDAFRQAARDGLRTQ
jgi:hypothetical protein